MAESTDKSAANKLRETTGWLTLTQQNAIDSLVLGKHDRQTVENSGGTIRAQRGTSWYKKSRVLSLWLDRFLDERAYGSEAMSVMANRQVALIRGINVGRAKRVAMAELRALVESLGYGDVRTLLNSGNIVFSVARAAPGNAAARIERALATVLGASARVTVLTAKELAAAITENPLLEVAKNPSRLLVAVPSNPAELPKLEPLLKQDWTPEVLAIGTRVAYLWCAEGILASKLAEAVSCILGDAVTARNWSTVIKLHAITED